MTEVEMIELLDSKLTGDFAGFEYDHDTGCVLVIDRTPIADKMNIYADDSAYGCVIWFWNSPSDFLFSCRSVFHVLNEWYDRFNRLKANSCIDKSIHRNLWILALKDCKSVDEIQLKLAVLGI